jgi:hypothetical protein
VSRVRNDVLEKRVATTFRWERISDLGTSAVTRSPNLITLMMEVVHSPETPVLIEAIPHHIQEYDILHSHPRENSNITISYGMKYFKEFVYM